MFSFSNCHHQWLKWPTLNQGEFGHSSIIESKLRHQLLLKQLNYFPVVLNSRYKGKNTVPLLLVKDDHQQSTVIGRKTFAFKH